MMEIDEVPTLPEDPTIAQMREYREEKKKMNKAKTYIHLALTDEVFTKIMTYYSERLKKVVNKIRLLGEELPDDRVVEKILVTLPKRFESKISSVEESRDLSEISLADLLHALEAQEQRRTYRNESNIEGAFKANEVSQIQPKGKNQQQPWKKKGSQNGANRGKFPPCQHCIKLISDVMLVPEISQNLLSVRQLLEKGYSVIFKNNMCFITDSCGAELFYVKMKYKSFCLDWDEAEFKAYPCVVCQAELWHKSWQQNLTAKLTEIGIVRVNPKEAGKLTKHHQNLLQKHHQNLLQNHRAAS
nr:Retrovirus-related Pol polyprotein from transposon RE1 [Ipomoea batatas]